MSNLFFYYFFGARFYLFCFIFSLFLLPDWPTVVPALFLLFLLKWVSVVVAIGVVVTSDFFLCGLPLLVFLLLLPKPLLLMLVELLLAWELNEWFVGFIFLQNSLHITLVVT